MMTPTDTPGPLTHSLAMGPCGVMGIAGGGGKTSLMFHLAWELAARGGRVLATTTTKIFRPPPEHSPLVIVTPDVQTVLDTAGRTRAGAGPITAARKELPDQGKLCGFYPGQVDELARSGCFDWILVEADGARRKPLKACASHEPVLPASTTLTVITGGLDVLGRPLTEEWVFRSALAAERIGIRPGDLVTEKEMAALLAWEIRRLTSPKPVATAILLNKADTEPRRAAALRVADHLHAHLPGLLDRVVITTLSGTSPLVHGIIPGKKQGEEGETRGIDE